MPIIVDKLTCIRGQLLHEGQIGSYINLLNKLHWNVLQYYRTKHIPHDNISTQSKIIKTEDIPLWGKESRDCWRDSSWWYRYRTSPLWRREEAEIMCQLSSCTTDRSCVAWFWPGLSLHYCVPGHYPGPSACSHPLITRCPLPSGGSTWSPPGFHPAHRTGLCQQLKMCNDVHHQLPDVITEFTKTNSTHRTASKLLAIFSSYHEIGQLYHGLTVVYSDSHENLRKCFFRLSE